MNILSEKRILELSSAQAQVFSDSLKLPFSSNNFIISFLKNPKTMRVDQGEYVDMYEYYDQVINKKKSFKKYTEKQLHWIGYLLRYWAMHEHTSSLRLANIIEPDELVNFYETYHTMDIEKALDSILEIKKSKIEDINKEYKRRLTKEECKKIVTR